jgi:hypothetical protein
MVPHIPNIAQIALCIIIIFFLRVPWSRGDALSLSNEIVGPSQSTS